MRNHFKYIVAILLLLFVSVSCTSNFEDVSKNPNASDEALPQALLAPALTSVVKANMSRTRSLTNELMQVTVLMGDIEGRIFRYDIRKSVADYLWNNWYVQLTNFKDMYETAQTLYTVESDKTYNTYMGISLICQCWVFSMLTDTYGDIPYTEACQGKKGILTPVFDRQEDIYTDIFAKLEQANELLANGSDLPEDQVICDPLFQGNALKWRKLSNSLYLRLLLRVSGKEEETAAAKIAEILEERPTDYPIMTSNDDSALDRRATLCFAFLYAPRFRLAHVCPCRIFPGQSQSLERSPPAQMGGYFQRRIRRRPERLSRRRGGVCKITPSPRPQKRPPAGQHHELCRTGIHNHRSLRQKIHLGRCGNPL